MNWAEGYLRKSHAARNEGRSYDPERTGLADAASWVVRRERLSPRI